MTELGSSYSGMKICPLNENSDADSDGDLDDGGYDSDCVIIDPPGLGYTTSIRYVTPLEKETQVQRGCGSEMNGKVKPLSPIDETLSSNYLQIPSL
jgi:hypothetical protein